MRKPRVRAGRPKLPRDTVKGTSLNIRLTEPERKAVERAAGSESLSQWVRRVLVAAAGL